MKKEEAATPKGNEFYYNAGTNQLELKSAPSELRPKLPAAGKDSTAGARYIPREERIQHHLDTLEAERSKRRNARFI